MKICIERQDGGIVTMSRQDHEIEGITRTILWSSPCIDRCSRWKMIWNTHGVVRGCLVAFIVRLPANATVLTCSALIERLDWKRA